jgi:hypothetical protein
VIIADTGAVFALLDAHDAHHATVRELYLADPDAWVLPWVVLPETDYLVQSRLGDQVEAAFLEDLTGGRFTLEWGIEDDLERANELNRQYQALKLGLVDGVVMSIAERLKAGAIATLDLKHFGAVKLLGAPRLLPRDL